LLASGQRKLDDARYTAVTSQEMVDAAEGLPRFA
jgi:hypothetical protein